MYFFNNKKGLPVVESNFYPISPKTPDPQYQPMERKKRNGNSLRKKEASSSGELKGICCSLVHTLVPTMVPRPVAFNTLNILCGLQSNSIHDFCVLNF